MLLVCCPSVYNHALVIKQQHLFPKFKKTNAYDFPNQVRESKGHEKKNEPSRVRNKKRISTKKLLNLNRNLY